MVGQVSARAFLGKDKCRDDRWLAISTNYGTDSFKAVCELRAYPMILWPIVHWFLPSFQLVRKRLKDCREIVNAEVQKRREEKAACAAANKPYPKRNDVVEWYEDAANGRPYDLAHQQLVISVVSVHSTTDLVTQVLYNLCRHQELLEPLREEIRSVIAEEGWTKKGLYRLDLLDSVIKETQRMKPINTRRFLFFFLLNTCTCTRLIMDVPPTFCFFVFSHHESRGPRRHCIIRWNKTPQGNDDRSILTPIHDES